MTTVPADVPAIQYSYVCQPGDAARFTRAVISHWLTSNRGFWIFLVAEAAVIVAAAALTASWWLLLAFPALVVIIVGLNYWQAARRHRLVAAPGVEWASGFAADSFRVIDGGAQVVLGYSRVASVDRLDNGFLAVKLRPRGAVLLPVEIAPPQAEAVMRGALTREPTR
ncbi:hypothetical protein [Gordonia crocea]|uniref:DUF304 domain-containing protein n=1 Tax=Gordonia crocea TaxID=589162 RepID=A0A7I9V1S7_9ACTN|nr:hypothetical protein [Gordonia crocea]GED99101.1 hypothetical protein nbrc107697_31400 [Gordonia crocea]